MMLVASVTSIRCITRQRLRYRPNPYALALMLRYGTYTDSRRNMSSELALLKFVLLDLMIQTHSITIGPTLGTSARY